MWDRRISQCPSVSLIGLCHGYRPVTYDQCLYVAETTVLVAKDVDIRPTSISFLRICQSPATPVVVVACLRAYSSVRWWLLVLVGLVHWENSSSMLLAVFVQMAGNSVVAVSRCDKSWYELYVWWLSWRRWLRRGWFRLVDSEGEGNDGGDWLGEETGDGFAWWKKMTACTARRIAVNDDLDVPTSESSSSSSDRRYDCTRIVASQLSGKFSKGERCFKELVINNHMLERPWKVEKSSNSPSLFSRWAC